MSLSFVFFNYSLFILRGDLGESGSLERKGVFTGIVTELHQSQIFVMMYLILFLLNCLSFLLNHSVVKEIKINVSLCVSFVENRCMPFENRQGFNTAVSLGKLEPIVVRCF